MLSYEDNKERVRTLHNYPDQKLGKQLRILAAACPTGGRVLDIACGNGRVLAALRDKGSTCFGIDLSPGAVALCKEKGLDVIVGDADTFMEDQRIGELLLAPYDVVIFTKSLAHLKNKNELMHRLKAKHVLIHQNNPSNWRRILDRRRGNDPELAVKYLPYIAADGTPVRLTGANAIRRWGESYGYRGKFIRGGGLLSRSFILHLERI